MQGKKRRRGEGFAGDVKAEPLADFLADLPSKPIGQLPLQVISATVAHLVCLAQNQCSSAELSGASSVKHIIVDQAHKLTDQHTLAVLLKLRELTGTICFVLVKVIPYF